MSNLKIKIAYEDDIRLFKTTSNSTELLNKIISFVKETHKIETFRLVYKDNEEDEITIVDNDDLKEALNNNDSNKTTKLYVKKINKELESDSTSDESSPNEEEIELEYVGGKGWGVMFGGFHRPRHHRRHHRGHHRGHKHHKHGRHHHHKHHHGHHHGHHGHHGRKFGRRGGMHKHCGFFKKFEKCQKDKDLRVDIIDENVSLGKNSFVSGGKYLIKTWKLKNVGNKVIPSNCNIEYFGRRFNLMVDGSKFELKNKEIDINEEFEVSISVKSPIQNGKYRSKWRLVTPDGKKFGQPLFVSFIVNDNNSNNNYNNKMLKKQEKLRYKKEKLLQKLQLLQERSNQLNNNNNNDDKDDIKEEAEGNETQNSSSDNSNVNENEIIIDETDIYETLEDGEDTFIYGEQLKQLKNMGFYDENQLKELLKSNNGSIQAVLNNIF